MLTRTWLCLLIGSPLLIAVASGQPSPLTAPQVAERVQQHYDRVRDFTADFVQEAESGVLRKKLVERGTLLVKKPGKMRWTYTSPEKKTFVSDGTKMYMDVPADRQVIVSTVPREDQATTAILFLSGKGSLTRDFTVQFAEGAAPPLYALRLQPKLQERDYDWLELTVQRDTFQIASLTANDRQGIRSTFQFTKLKENVGLADSAFVFTIPRGADVIQAGPTGR